MTSAIIFIIHSYLKILPNRVNTQFESELFHEQFVHHDWVQLSGGGKKRRRRVTIRHFSSIVWWALFIVLSSAFKHTICYFPTLPRYELQHTAHESHNRILQDYLYIRQDAWNLPKHHGGIGTADWYTMNFSICSLILERREPSRKIPNYWRNDLLVGILGVIQRGWQASILNYISWKNISWNQNPSIIFSISTILQLRCCERKLELKVLTMPGSHVYSPISSRRDL